MQMNNALEAYAAYAKDASLRMSSSSGAVFSLLAEWVLSGHGVVYGVAMSADCRDAEYRRVDDLHELSRLRGSKYLQARMGDTYQQVKSDLEAGTKVLFSGAGCQVNGLKMYLKKDYDNLVCVDVVCHGVPSPALWKKYVRHMEEQNGSKLISVNFRCKDDSWGDFGIKELDENSKEMYQPKDEDPFMLMFLRNYCLRPSCYECAAKAVKMSDITIADFWGIEDVVPEMDDGRGVSLVLIRCSKGLEMFAHVKSRLVYRKVSYKEGVKNNPSEYQSVLRPKKRDQFFRDMNTLEFRDLQKKYAMPVSVSLIGRIKKRIKRTKIWTKYRGVKPK